MKRFDLSSISAKNPLGKEGRCIRTAAALVIGDEILNGKTMDKNSNYFAKYCFERGIDLKRIEVIPDDENEIIEASRRLTSQYDFVITTGGIGPTHDDITYASLARAFNQSLAHHPETLRRLDEMNRHRAWVSTQTHQQREATKRMALFPERAEVLFVCGDIWVPVVRLEGKLCIFPGIPTLFTKMLDGLAPYLPLPPASERPLRVQIFTEYVLTAVITHIGLLIPHCPPHRRPESMIAPYLTALHARMKNQKADIQVGSYPVLGKGVFVSLIGRDRNMGLPGQGVLVKTEQRSQPGAQSSEAQEPPAQVWLAQIACEVEKEINGRIVSDEEVKILKESGLIHFYFVCFTSRFVSGFHRM
ncbi:MoaB/Mog domain-containing protein [Lentinula lateritia]|nr:MoaB/Mog domain-containing protein [Lentinula lateritia]